MLLIEKAVKLMDDFHFDLLREYVKNISKRSYYPLALIDVISRDVAVEQSSEELYFKTYGEKEPDEKAMKKFFQLAHYTFKLTGYLSKNYPNYLKHNITLIQHAINTGDPGRANLILDMTIDLAQKIEDRDTELTLLSILIQREELQESALYTKKWHERINELLDQKKAINNILERLHLYFTAKSKPKEGMELKPHLDFFKIYHKSKSLTVSLISRFSSCFIRYYVKDSSFYKPETLKELDELEKEMERSPQLIFPFLLSINHRIALLKLYYRLREMEASQVLDEAKKIMEDSKDTLYWNSFINLPEVLSLVVHTSHYLSHYYYSYRDDYHSMMEEEVLKEIEKLKYHCKKMLDQPELEERFTVRHINLTYMYAGLLILGEQEERKEGIQLLNNLLLSFQQVPFHAFIDPLYAIMILGYFSLRDYDKVGDSYNRYKKATKGKAVNPENDLTINGLYYLSKWLATERAQYIKKLNKVLEATNKPNLKSTQTLILEAANYFNMPLPLEN